MQLIKDLQHDFLKMRGGVKGHWELFRKFIRFGIVTRPLGLVLPQFHLNIESNTLKFKSNNLREEKSFCKIMPHFMSAT